MEYTFILKACGIAIVAVIAITVVKQLRAEFVFPMRAIASLVFFSIIIALMIPILDYVGKLSDMYGITKYSDILLKALSITVTFKITSDICLELGEPMIAGAVESVCKLQLIILSIPIIDSIIDTVIGLL